MRVKYTSEGFYLLDVRRGTEFDENLTPLSHGSDSMNDV